MREKLPTKQGLRAHAFCLDCPLVPPPSRAVCARAHSYGAGCARRVNEHTRYRIQYGKKTNTVCPACGSSVTRRVFDKKAVKPIPNPSPNPTPNHWPTSMEGVRKNSGENFVYGIHLDKMPTILYLIPGTWYVCFLYFP